jgi:hypothetical protein
MKFGGDISYGERMFHKKFENLISSIDDTVIFMKM